MPKKTSNKPTRYVNFRTYKEPIRDDVWGSGFSPFASLVSIVAVGFLVFYIVFGIDDPIEIYDALVDKVVKFAKLTSLTADVWEKFTSSNLDFLEYNGSLIEIPKDWSDHFLSPGEMFKYVLGFLFPDKLGVS